MLNDKQQRFCEEYVIDLNATQAAIRAGYSEKTANRIGSENLSKLDIQEYIKTLKQKASDILEITHQDVLKRLKTWAESDITETIGLTGEQLKELPLEVKQLITSYKHTRRTFLMGEDPVSEDMFELKFVSKEKAIEMIGRHIGFYEKDNSQLAGNIMIFEIPDNGRG